MELLDGNEVKIMVVVGERSLHCVEFLLFRRMRIVKEALKGGVLPAIHIIVTAGVRELINRPIIGDTVRVGREVDWVVLTTLGRAVTESDLFHLNDLLEG